MGIPFWEPLRLSDLRRAGTPEPDPPEKEEGGDDDSRCSPRSMTGNAGALLPNAAEVLDPERDHE